jgi:hypothetical protein
MTPEILAAAHTLVNNPALIEAINGLDAILAEEPAYQLDAVAQACVGPYDLELLRRQIEELERVLDFDPKPRRGYRIVNQVGPKIGRTPRKTGAKA